MAQWITRLTTDQKIPGSNPGKIENILSWEKYFLRHKFLTVENIKITGEPAIYFMA